jgi:hypothetical protein
LIKPKALEATTVPASLLGKSNKIGTLKTEVLLTLHQAKYSTKTTIYENWVEGNKYVIKDMTPKIFAVVMTLIDNTVQITY